MKKQSLDKFKRAGEEFEASLDTLLDALDREHYPLSLLESISAVLKAPGAPRGLPLFLQTTALPAESEFSSRLPVACESMLRAFLLIAQLQIENPGRVEASLCSRLSRKYSRAQLLLTADTLFTWPLELVAAERVSAGGPLSAVLAETFGVNGCLAGLDSTEAGVAGLMELDPFTELGRALGISDIETSGAAGLAARWLYYNELAHWFGPDKLIGRRLEELEAGLSGQAGCGQPQARGMAELVSFLGR